MFSGILFKVKSEIFMFQVGRTLIWLFARVFYINSWQGSSFIQPSLIRKITYTKDRAHKQLCTAVANQKYIFFFFQFVMMMMVQMNWFSFCCYPLHSLLHI